jgi:hypothetical protein
MTDKTYTQEELDSAIEDATQPLIKKRDELLKEVKVARKNLENVGDVEKLHERIEALETERDTLVKQTKETTKQLEAVAKQLESESGFTSKLLLDNGLTDALVKAGIKKELLPAAKALFSQQAKVIADGESRKAVIGDKELSAFVTEWSASDEGKHFVSAPANGGGGADGSKSTPQGDKIVNRSTWDTMSHVERSQFATSGGKVTD